MGGFRLSATARENLFRGGSTELGKRTESPLVVNEDHPLFTYISSVAKQLDVAQKLGIEERWKARKKILCNLIPKLFYYRHEPSGGSWTTNYTWDNEPTDDIWEGVLTTRALVNLLSENLIHLPSITKDEITERSKGDALSKGFALLQLTWFIIQIITRAVQGSEISELELTTAALVGLNSIMYVFWWSKPYDVRSPVVIRTNGVKELLAKRVDNTTWSFSDWDSKTSFDFRKYLWKSMIETIICLFNSIDQTLTSLTISVNAAWESFLNVLKAFSSKISLSLSLIRRLVTQIGRAGKDDSQNHNKNKGPNDGRDDLNACQEPVNSETSDVMRVASPTPSSSGYARKKVSTTIIFNLLVF